MHPKHVKTRLVAAIVVSVVLAGSLLSQREIHAQVPTSNTVRQPGTRPNPQSYAAQEAPYAAPDASFAAQQTQYGGADRHSTVYTSNTVVAPYTDAFQSRPTRSAVTNQMRQSRGPTTSVSTASVPTAQQLESQLSSIEAAIARDSRQRTDRDEVARATYKTTTGVTLSDTPTNAIPPASQRDWLQQLNDSALKAEQRSVPGSSVEPTADQTTTSGESFIKREKKTAASAPSETLSMVTRIGVNLAIVLAAAIGGLLVLRQWQRNKSTTAADANIGNLNVVQILPLANGAALHVVDGFQKRLLLAIDSAGIKSVDVLDVSFDQTMHRVEVNSPDLDTMPLAERRRMQSERKSGQSTKRHPSEPPEDLVEPTPEIDQQLIELLLRGGKQAA